MKKVLIIIAAIVLVLGLGAGVGFAIYANKPENVAIGAIKGAVEDFVERDEINPVYNMLTKGSLTASVEKIEMNGEDMLDGGSFSGKIYFSDMALMVDDLEMEYGDIQISGSLYLSDEMIYIKEDNIIDGAYGARFEDLADNFADSIFAYGSGSDYAIPDEEIYDMVINLLEAVADNEAIRKDSEKLMKKHTKEIWKIVCDNAEFESENDTVRLNGEKKNVRVITITIDDKAAANIVNDVYEYLRDDDSIPKFLDKHGEALIPVLAKVLDKEVDEIDSIGELYEEYLEEMEDQIDDLCDMVEDNFEEVAIEVITPKLGSKLLKLNVESDDETVLSIDFGEKGVKDTDEITVTRGEEKITYSISENSRKAYTATLKVGKETVLKISVDKSRKTFSVSAGDDNEGFKVKGSFSTKGDKTTIEIEKISYTESSENFDPWTDQYNHTTTTTEIKTDITLVIDEKDKIPAAPKNFDTIDDITDEDIEAWMENIQDLMG